MPEILRRSFAILWKAQTKSLCVLGPHGIADLHQVIVDVGAKTALKSFFTVPHVKCGTESARLGLAFENASTVFTAPFERRIAEPIHRPLGAYNLAAFRGSASVVGRKTTWWDSQIDNATRER